MNIEARGFGDVRWVVQDNLISQADTLLMKEACESLGVDFYPVQVVPFSEDLPHFPVDEKQNVYYGATQFINSIYRNYNPKGIFYSEDDFSMMNYVQRWGGHMLSGEAKKMTLSEFIEQSVDPNEQWFIRPDADDKSFDGSIMAFHEVCDWYNKLAIAEDNELSLGFKPALGRETLIIAGPAYNIEKEWRNFIVDGRVVTSSMYRKNFRLHKSSVDVPQNMLDFVHDRCEEYQPHKAFVMDIALCGGGYYIIECGCINSAGFYLADVQKIIEAVSLEMVKPT